MSKLYNLYKLGKAALSKKKKTLTVDKGALRISEINKKLKEPQTKLKFLDSLKKQVSDKM